MANDIPTKIEANIDYFLERCLDYQEEFRKKIKKVAEDADSLKFLVASKYQIAGEDPDASLSMRKRMQESLLNKIEYLAKDYVNIMTMLSKEYQRMMKNHRELSLKWKGKNLAFPQYYNEIKDKVLTEKKGYIEKINLNCQSIQQDADRLRTRLLALFTNSELENNATAKEYKHFLEELVKEDATLWLKSVMLADNLQED